MLRFWFIRGKTFVVYDFFIDLLFFAKVLLMIFTILTMKPFFNTLKLGILISCTIVKGTS